MPDTPRGYPVPSGTDRPDVVRDLTALAEAVDTDVSSLWRNGIASVPSSATFTSSVAVTFSGDPFSPTPPMVVATVAGNPTRRLVRVENLTATGCTISVHTSDGTALGTQTTVYWLATARS
jgi:hypothetical protein